MLDLEPVEPLLLAGAAQRLARPLRPGPGTWRREPPRPAPARASRPAARQRTRGPWTASRTAGRLRPLDPAQQALVDELLKSVQDLDAQVDRRRADGLGALEADTAAEHRAGRQQAPGARTEQPVAPGDRAAQGLLTLRQVTGTADEQGQRMLQPCEQRRGRQELDPRRRQFDREGQAIEPPGDPRDHGRVLLVEDETRLGGAGALGEQPHRLAARDRGDRRALLVRHPQGEGLHTPARR